MGGGIADRLAGMALDEATRPVTVREGDKVSKIPAMQALVRTMFRAAAQGDTKAGRQLLEVIARAETARAAFKWQILQKAVQYKEYYGPIFDQCERNGRAPPEIFPHPDDVLIDHSTGEVTCDGPMSKEEAGARKAIREHANEIQARGFSSSYARLDEIPPTKPLRREFKELNEMYEFARKDTKRLSRHQSAATSPARPTIRSHLRPQKTRTDKA